MGEREEDAKNEVVISDPQPDHLDFKLDGVTTGRCSSTAPNIREVAKPEPPATLQEQVAAAAKEIGELRVSWNMTIREWCHPPTKIAPIILAHVRPDAALQAEREKALRILNRIRGAVDDHWDLDGERVSFIWAYDVLRKNIQKER